MKLIDLIPVVVCLYILSQLTTIGINNKNATSGIEYQQKLEQIEKLKIEQMLLEQELASKSSLIRIKEKAKEMGFTENRSIKIIQ
jgi:cell division protein FtsL